MEKGDQASDCDSDETVIEGSVTENELEDDELPWRRIIKLLDDIDQLHFITGMHSPEIQLGLKLRKDSQEQNDKNEVLRALSEDLVLQVRLCCLNIHLSKAGTAIWQITN
ncbi:rCG64384, partial [Rattus norvegicus]